ncbi:pyroglutamyl-peptidase I [Serratia microhaemolytica]|uniref:pyroglutamyl-peptidase I n=1 Tax=Serratia microhaemolytica TaxID=2675110 RepID=UPI000FDD9112|nr:pyroglutamyl-peptidase I [Serratia microhaemolytica]
MRCLLMTGFEPFDGESINPSWEVLKQLDGWQLNGVQVVARQLPCVFGDSLTVLNAAIDQLQPVAVIAVGQAGGRVDITPERVAINVDDARIADNRGQQPIDQPIIADGPAGYFSTLPIKAMVAALRDAGIPASVSQSAGSYVCNRVMYGLLHRLRQQPEVKAGFIHIPYLPQQAAKHPGAPSVSAQTLVAGLKIAVAVTLQFEQDLKLVGGATH